MACERYEKFYWQLVLAHKYALRNGYLSANDCKIFKIALCRLRAHSEECNCITLDMQRAFPELKKIKTKIVPLSVMEEIDEEHLIPQKETFIDRILEDYARSIANQS